MTRPGDSVSPERPRPPVSAARGAQPRPRGRTTAHSHLPTRTRPVPPLLSPQRLVGTITATSLPGPGGGHLGSSPSGRLCRVPRRSRDHLRGALTANHLIYIWVPDLFPSPGVGRSSYTQAGTPPAHAGQPVPRALGLLPPAAATKSDRTQGTRHPGTASAEAAIQSGKKNMHFLSVSDDLESGES